MPATRRKKKTTRRRVRLTEAARKKRETAIISDLKAGKLSYRKIAEKHKVSLPTVNAKARKANITRPRGRRPLAVSAAAVSRPRAKTGRTRVARTAKRVVARRSRPRTRSMKRTAAPSAFQEALREMVLRYYPSITLKKFDRLTKLVKAAVK